nr:uncharacterized protein LOC111752039 [Loxodonta africana]
MTIMISTSDFQSSTTSVTHSTSPQTSSTTGSPKQMAHIHGTQKMESDTTVITPSKGTTLSSTMATSMLMDQGESSRITASSSVATSAEMSKENQRVSTMAPVASNTAVNRKEPAVSIDSEELTATTTSTALNTTGNDVTSSGSMRTRVSKNSATALAPTTPNISKDMKESLSTTTSPESTSATFTTLGTTMSGTQGNDITSSGSMTNIVSENSVTTTAPTTMNISKDMKESLYVMASAESTSVTFATFGTTMSGTLGNDITASGSMRSTVSKKSATTTAPTTLNISKDMKESLLVTTSVQPTPVTFTTLGTAMSATPGSDITSSGSMRSTVFEKSATITASTTPNINKDLRESLCTTTSVQPSPVTVTTLGTTMSGTPGKDIIASASVRTTVFEKSAVTTAPTVNISKDMKESLYVTSAESTSVTFTTFETQEEETTAAPSALTMVFTKDMNSSISLMSTLSETYHNTATQTPSHLAELASSAGTATAQSPETTAAHSTALISRSSGTTKSSPVAEDSHLP